MANTKVPIELSSTPGIVDNSTATAITIDSAGAATFSAGITTTGINVTGTASMDGLIVNTGSYGAVGAGSGRMYGSTTHGLVIQGNGTTNDFLFLGSDGSELLSIADNGNLGVGVTPSAWSTAYDAIQVAAGGALWGNASTASVYVSSNIYFDGAAYKALTTAASALYLQSGGQHIWYNAASVTAGATATAVSRMTLDASGNLLVGSSSPPANRRLYVESVNYPAQMYATTAGINYPTLQLKNAHATGGNTCTQIDFRNAADASVGQVKSTASATIFATSSDYRLKEDDVAMTGATERVKALRPINFAWKLDGSRVDGFFAHELAEVVPEAATGTKDAMCDEEYEVTPAVEEVKDEEGNVTTEAVAAVMGTRSVPDYQGIDQSKLVPLLTATIQELIARIEALEGA